MNRELEEMLAKVKEHLANTPKKKVMEGLKKAGYGVSVSSTFITPELYKELHENKNPKKVLWADEFSDEENVGIATNTNSFEYRMAA